MFCIVVTSALTFSLSTRGAARTSTVMQLGVGPETNFQMFDPLGLATLGTDETRAFIRHAEIKHGRVSMLAFVGWLFAANHVHFPGMLDTFDDVAFGDLARLAPLEQWAALPTLGKLQILSTIGYIEWASESQGTHYMRGGKPGDYSFLKWFWDPLGLAGTKELTPAQREEKLTSELKNGRLAMIGIASALVASAVPGSVPFPGFPGAVGAMGVLPL